MKFTPGPWKYVHPQIMGEGIGIAEVKNRNMEANAALIASAPELYEAAKFVAQRLQEWADGLDVAGDSSSSMALQGWADDLKNALAKAEGRK